VFVLESSTLFSYPGIQTVRTLRIILTSESSLTIFITVVKHLSKAYNLNFGARSLAFEVEYVVLRLVAEAQMADQISEGCVVPYFLFSTLLNGAYPVAGLYIS